MSEYITMTRLRPFMIGTILMLGSAIVSAEKDEKVSAIFNKLKFFSWLVNDSPTVMRVIDSSDTDAINQLEHARHMLEQAQARYEDGDINQADEKITDGIRQMTTISRRFRDLDRVESARKQLFHEIKGRIQLFVDAYERVVIEKNNEIIDGLLDRDNLNSLIEQAEVLYREGQLALANHALKQAADMVELTLSSARHQDVLLHELSFGSLEEEYLYEIKRNESYVMLISLLQDKDQVSETSIQYVKKIVSENEIIKREAESHAANGNKAMAISVLEKGTDKLTRALRMSGTAF